MEVTTSVGSIPLFDHPYIDVCGEESCLVFLMLFRWVFKSIDEILLSLPASRLSYPSLFVHARCSSPSVTIVALCWTHTSAWAQTVCNLNVLLSWLAYCLFFIHTRIQRILIGDDWYIGQNFPGGFCLIVFQFVRFIKYLAAVNKLVY